MRNRCLVIFQPSIYIKNSRSTAPAAVLQLFTKYFFVGGHFSKCMFAEGSFNQKPLASGEIRGSIWRHFVMKLPPNNVKNHENERFHNSVRPDPAHPGPAKLRVICPHTSVLSKPPQLPYGAEYVFGGCSRFTGAVLNRKVPHHPTGPDKTTV